MAKKSGGKGSRGTYFDSKVLFLFFNVRLLFLFFKCSIFFEKFFVATV